MKQLEKHACSIRKHIIKMVSNAKSGHIGGSLSAVEIMTYLYLQEMDISKENANGINRDRFVLSKGHASPLLYAVLHELGCLKHDSFHHGKKRNTERTELIQSLASSVGTSVSNIYTIIRDASITVTNSNLVTYHELSVTAAFNKRTKLRKVSNISKLHKAKDFIDLVVSEVKSNTLSSIDETVNSLILHHQDALLVWLLFTL